jgi:hypothetical protein
MPFRIDPNELARYYDQRHRPHCSECRRPINRPFNQFTRTCSPKCERARKTRRQKERRRGVTPR